MVQGYYTLKEAAEATGLSEDELKQRAQRKEIRSFQDRGTLRFRIQDVQELQRQIMGGTDVDFTAPIVEALSANSLDCSMALGGAGGIWINFLQEPVSSRTDAMRIYFCMVIRG